jgi:predicted nucleic acid-binding protein
MAAGLKVSGALGLLVRAKILGLTPAIRPIVERMAAAGVWYHADLIARLLRAVDE